jgi:Xaa-Pro aminopeptidase
MAPSEIIASLKALANKKATVSIDPVWTPDAIRAALAGAKIVQAQDPCILPKARKNAIEREGARAAQRRDGVAMVRFLCWLESADVSALDEFGVGEKLAEFRKAGGQLLDLSFDSIPGSGPNAAIPHYHVSQETSRKLARDEIFLIDSGGQYQDGTTDITRTVIMGTPTPEMQDRFTRVLKGMIDLSRIRFPKGTCGSQLDVLARAALWQAGLDFDHGTGHGVGSYLSLEPGMILSNEPGYYKPGHYGIRIENLLMVTEETEVQGGDRKMLGFETLTLCPIDRRLIDQKLLTREELHWIDAYHARVLKEVGDHLSGPELDWLRAACSPLD